MTTRPKAPKHGRIDKAALAFGVEKQMRASPYLIGLRDDACILTGFRATEYEAVDAAHIGTAGKGLKIHDYNCLPVRHSLHTLGHNTGEMSMFREHMPDWLLRDALRAYAKQYWMEKTGNG